MRVAVASDHAGFPLKDAVTEAVRENGDEVIDLGTYDTQSVDYPDYAQKAGQALQNGDADRAIILCGSGVGACITANKMQGVYACLCHDTYSAAQGVEHDNMNALCIGARIIGVELARAIVLSFLNARFSTEERHNRRFNKMRAIEKAQK